MDYVKLMGTDTREKCDKLEEVAGTFEATTAEMLSIVGSFTGSWEGAAEAAFEEDYTVLGKNISSATEVLHELTRMTGKYVDQMEELQSSYAGSHVTIG